MRGKIIDLVVGMNGNHRITLELGNDRQRKVFLEKDYDRLKDKELDIEIRQHRKRRSLNANSYFHLLVNKIAEEQGLGVEEVKKHLVCEYGTLAKDADGMIVGFKLPASVDVSSIYPYVKSHGEYEENGKLFKGWLAYKQTRDMDSAEMARLIDGAVHEARELGIETDTPEQLARYKEEWNKRKE